jgi:hypothetical protein
MAIREVLTAPRSPWQSPHAERLIGSIRRECLDHLIVFNESSLRRLLEDVLIITMAVVRERCGGDQASSTAGAGVGPGTAGGRRTASPLRTAGGLKNCSRTEQGSPDPESTRRPA